MTGGYLGSQGVRFKAELPAQRRETDAKLAKFEQYLQTFDPARHGSDFKVVFDVAISNLRAVKDKRQSVDSFSITGAEAIAFYTKILSLFALNSQALSYAADGESARSIAAYSDILYAKEYVGQERATKPAGGHALAHRRHKPSLLKKAAAGEGEWAEF